MLGDQGEWHKAVLLSAPLLPCCPKVPSSPREDTDGGVGRYGHEVRARAGNRLSRTSEAQPTGAVQSGGPAMRAASHTASQGRSAGGGRGTREQRPTVYPILETAARKPLHVVACLRN